MSMSLLATIAIVVVVVGVVVILIVVCQSRRHQTSVRRAFEHRCRIEVNTAVALVGESIAYDVRDAVDNLGYEFGHSRVQQRRSKAEIKQFEYITSTPRVKKSHQTATTNRKHHKRTEHSTTTCLV
jgi:hypothetical protein